MTIRINERKTKETADEGIEDKMLYAHFGIVFHVQSGSDVAFFRTLSVGWSETETAAFFPRDSNFERDSQTKLRNSLSRYAKMIDLFTMSPMELLLDVTAPRFPLLVAKKQKMRI